MQNELYVFTAVEPAVTDKSKNVRLLHVTLFLIAVVMGVVSLKNGNRFNTFISCLFAVSYGIRLLPPNKRAPVTLTLNPSGLKLNDTNGEMHLDWKEIKMAQVNGRYLDMYWGSSFLQSISLDMFTANDGVEIVRLAGKYLSAYNVFIAAKQETGLAMA